MERGGFYFFLCLSPKFGFIYIFPFLDVNSVSDGIFDELILIQGGVPMQGRKFKKMLRFKKKQIWQQDIINEL